ncbi:MAG: long-chain fatty acid--CoA ligase [Candidatus Rokuibacteriota bacterium]|nr:MAG: long-chain fatty acid--CoA ligase [Candidatus Rokubacteria bacterium]
MEAEEDVALSGPPTVHGQDTLPRLFRHVVQQRGDAVAMREKDLGVWRAVTWRDYGERARRVGFGLVALGLRPRDVVSILAENGPEWLYTDLGTMSVGGVTNGIYTTDAPRQVEYIVNDSGTRFFFAGDEEQLDKILEVRARCPGLVKIVVFDVEGLHGFTDPQVMSFDDLLDLGARYEHEHPGAWDPLVEIARPDDLAILVYTSGTTGPPKGAMLSHRNIIFQLGFTDYLTPPREGDQQLSFLPLSHVAERTFTVFYPLSTGSTVNFAESIDTVPDNIREVAPAVFFAVPRIWEKFYSGVALRMREATRAGRLAYRWALGVGMRMAECRIQGRRPPLALRVLDRLADLIALDNVKRSMGLHRVRGAATGAAPIAPELIKWYMALGIDMREVYGQTENCGLATAMPADRIKLGTVGVARPGTEIRLSPQGEILLKGPHVFLGYYKNPERTAQTVIDGWLHTGDVGRMDAEGFVTITDRMKDIIITAGGKNVTPSEIENQLKFSPYISDAVVIGDQRKYLSCLVMIDHETVAQFAQEKNVPFTNFASLCRATEVQDLIWSEIERVNKQLARVETIKKFRLIEQLLTAEDEELTPTMKLKRTFVNRKYKDVIDGMYVEM